MKRLFFAILLFYCATTCAQISNLIVFGDSLSDLGNFPESPHLLKNPNNKKELSNMVAQLYVPFSNPTSLTINNPYLPKSIHHYRSISWSQYFLLLEKNKKIITSGLIAPFDSLEKQVVPNTISFNYAWGYATSARDCVNPNYQAIKNCNAKSIMDAKIAYEKNPSRENYLKIEIPGLFEQEKLFLQNVKENKVAVNQQTLYVFWIGGNDLIDANNDLMKHYNPLPALHFLLGGVANHEIKNAWYLVHNLPANQLPKKIYIFTLFNPALTPEYYNKTLGMIANAAVQASNFWLHIESSLFNLFSKTKIEIVPTYQWFQKSAESAEFKSTMGKDCQLNGRYPDDAISSKKGKADCGDFMFWNAVHPSASMNAVVADNFLRSR